MRSYVLRRMSALLPFTLQGELVITRGSDRSTSRHVGPDVIARYVDDASKVQADQRRHAMTNVVIDRLSAQEATAIAYGIVTVAANGLSLGATVIYSAELRKEGDGVWRFSRFVIGMDDYAVGGGCQKGGVRETEKPRHGRGRHPNRHCINALISGAHALLSLTSNVKGQLL